MTRRRALFEHWAAGYDASVGAESFPFIGYDHVLQAVVAESGVNAGSRVLELGAGTANLAARFAALGCDLVCTDFSQAMLEEARAKLPNADLMRLDLRNQDDWQRLEGHFEVIAASYVLHEFPLEWNAKLLAHLAEHHLNAGGRIVVADIAFADARTRAEAHAYWEDVWDEEEFYFAADEALTAFVQAGLHGSYRQVSACAGVFTVRAGSRGG
jgi:cyclopropane fatty-acyl-phospholipid synthase-like methyltransferase